jgi:hypothetical protein
MRADDDADSGSPKGPELVFVGNEAASEPIVFIQTIPNRGYSIFRLNRAFLDGSS